MKKSIEDFAILVAASAIILFAMLLTPFFWAIVTIIAVIVVFV